VADKAMGTSPPTVQDAGRAASGDTGAASVAAAKLRAAVLAKDLVTKRRMLSEVLVLDPANAGAKKLLSEVEAEIAKRAGSAAAKTSAGSKRRRSGSSEGAAATPKRRRNRKDGRTPRSGTRSKKDDIQLDF